MQFHSRHDHVEDGTRKTSYGSKDLFDVSAYHDPNSAFRYIATIYTARREYNIHDLDLTVGHLDGG